MQLLNVHLAKTHLSQPELFLEPMAADALAAWHGSAWWPEGSRP